MLNISEYRDLISLFGEFSEKELSPKRLEIDKKGEAFKGAINKLEELGVFDEEINSIPLPVKIKIIMELSRGEAGIAQFVAKSWTVGNLGIARSEKLVQFPSERVYYNGKLAEFKGENVDVLGLRSCSWALGEIRVLGDYGNFDKEILFYDIACLVGISEAALESAENYAKERKAFDRTIYDFEEIRGFIQRGRSYVEGIKGALLVSEDPMKLLNLALEMAYFCTDKAMQIFGGYSFINEYPVQKFLRDARMLRSLLIRKLW